MLASVWWLWLSLGLFVGAILGVLIAGLLAAGAAADRTSEAIYDALPKDDLPDIGIEHRPDLDDPDSPAD